MGKFLSGSLLLSDCDFEVGGLRYWMSGSNNQGALWLDSSMCWEALHSSDRDHIPLSDFNLELPGLCKKGLEDMEKNS